jgi:hypothetical protein
MRTGVGRFEFSEEESVSLDDHGFLWEKEYGVGVHSVSWTMANAIRGKKKRESLTLSHKDTKEFSAVQNRFSVGNCEEEKVIGILLWNKPCMSQIQPLLA